MSEEAEESQEDEGGSGAPAWVMTFADLMSLLMCFFVLLLAFSEMDVLKFKQLSGSMKAAFGVQREIKADEIPKGTSIITQEFSPGIPQPTAIPIIQQQTTDDTKDNLEFSEGNDSDNKNIAQQMYEAAVESIREDAEKLVKELKDEIEQGMLEVEWSESEMPVRLSTLLPAILVPTTAAPAPAITTGAQALKINSEVAMITGSNNFFVMMNRVKACNLR